jgi:tetratricopeptide (TPR) repeat protein
MFKISLNTNGIDLSVSKTDFPIEHCKSGRFYVYVHKGLDGIVFYVDKGTGNRAYSKDRQPEWYYYVEKILKNQYDVEIVRDGISEEDAERIEDALLAKYAETVINLQTMHAPYNTGKYLEYCNAIHAYSTTFKLAMKLEKEGTSDMAIKHYEAAYEHYIEANSSNDYHLGARRLLPKQRIAPTQLADHYSKCLAKQGLHEQVVTFYERFISDFGEGRTGVEIALKNRAEKSRMKVLR